MSSNKYSRNEKYLFEESKQQDSKSSINVYKIKTENNLITENISLENNNFKKILLYLEKTKQENIFDDEFINNFEAEIKNQILIKKIKEEFKGKQKYKKVIQDKINIIKIYIDFKNLYQKFKNIMSQPISQTFEDIVNNKNLFENKETLKLFIDDFDLLYKRIKINLFHLSNKFF